MTVDIAEIARYMRMGRSLPDGELAGRVERMRDQALKTLRTARVWRRFPIDGNVIESGGLKIEIRGTIARHIAGCHAAYLVCGTIGAEFDAFQRRVSVSSGVDALVAQAIGAALIEKWMDETNAEIEKELEPGESIVSRYSPGYGDFPLSEQRTIFKLLDTSHKIGVSLTDNLLMVPSKSVSAVIGVKKGTKAE